MECCKQVDYQSQCPTSKFTKVAIMTRRKVNASGAVLVCNCSFFTFITKSDVANYSFSPRIVPTQVQLCSLSATNGVHSTYSKRKQTPHFCKGLSGETRKKIQSHQKKSARPRPPLLPAAYFRSPPELLRHSQLHEQINACNFRPCAVRYSARDIRASGSFLGRPRLGYRHHHGMAESSLKVRQATACPATY